MGKLTLKIILFVLLLSSTTVALLWERDVYNHPFYRRFTTPRQHSLVVGSSRAAQGILPQVVDSVTGHKGLYNYAMTLATSPYGASYTSSIFKKLGPPATESIFLLDVSPLNLSIDSATRDLPECMPELKRPRCNPLLVNAPVNLEYLIRWYDEPWIHLLLQDSTPYCLHENGWLEITIASDSASVARRMAAKLKYYRKEVAAKRISLTRMRALASLADSLAAAGELFLVRVPVHPDFRALEDELAPRFDYQMQALASQRGAVYLNFDSLNARMHYTDGNHLHKSSARRFSELLGLAIRKYTAETAPGLQH